MSSNALSAEARQASGIPSSRYNYYWTGLVVLILYLGINVALSFWQTPGLVLISVWAVWVCLVAGYVWTYVDAADKGSESYRNLPEWKQHLQIPKELCRVPQTHLYRIVSFLGDDPEVGYQEDRVEDLFRRHWYDVVRRTLPAILVGILGLAVAMGGLAVKDSGSYVPRLPHITLPRPIFSPKNLPKGLGTGPTATPSATPTPLNRTPEPSATSGPTVLNHTPVPSGAVSTPPLRVPHIGHFFNAVHGYQFKIAWWVPLLGFGVAIIAGITAWVRSWKWSYRYTMLTDKSAYIITAPPRLILPLLKKNDEKIELIWITRVFASQKGLGLNLRFGDVGMNLEGEFDKDFNRLRWVADPVLVRTRINNANRRLRDELRDNAALEITRGTRSSSSRVSPTEPPG